MAQPVSGPFLGVGPHVRSSLRAMKTGERTVLDLLLSAVRQGEKTWSALACLLSVDWDEDELKAALTYVGRYVGCVSADGVIDVRGIDAIVRVSGREHELGTWTVDADPRRSLPVSAVILRNWGKVNRFGRQRGTFRSKEAFPDVVIPWDLEALMKHFGQAMVDTNGRTAKKLDRSLFEMRLMSVGLPPSKPEIQPFVPLVITGWHAIDNGEDDPVALRHFRRDPLTPQVVAPKEDELVAQKAPPEKAASRAESDAEYAERTAREHRERIAWDELAPLVEVLVADSDAHAKALAMALKRVASARK